MFRRVIIILIILLAWVFKLDGQVRDTYKYIDSLTYSLYSQGKWDTLIKEGRYALDKGYDYYYMRMRIAIAYYEKHNYSRAATHFRKALKFNDMDQVALEYLFYCHYLSGRKYQAWAILSQLNTGNRERVIDESGIRTNNVSIESFYSDAVTNNILSDPDQYFTNPEAGNQIATDYFINNEIYASHIIGDNLGYFHSYTNLIKKNHLHYFDGTYSANLFPQRVVQNQYYGSLVFFTSGGWLFSPAFHYLDARYQAISVSSVGFNNTYLNKYDLHLKGYIAGLSLTRSLGYITVGTEAALLDFNDLRKLQGNISLTVYPIGSASLYFGGKLSMGQKINSTLSDLYIVGGFIAGFSVKGKIWFEISGLTGNMDYYSDNNGLYLYNSPDVIRNKLLATVVIPVKNTGLSFYAGGGISSYTSKYIPLDGTLSGGGNSLNYSNNNFTGGISWNF